ncbi:MAG: COX15/CtaA family protein [Pseudomonadota bacterium]|nr:COX15/CtaA family protein [Pseudomonadota bacterium]
MNIFKSNSSLAIASAASVAAIFVQIMLGAVTRLMGAGLSCPDWPLCYGLWIPLPSALSALPNVDYTYVQILMEWTHRANAAVVLAPLICWMTFLSWRFRKSVPACWWLGAFALLLLLVQSAVGGFTVLDRNSPWSVAVHLSLASLLLATTVSILKIARLGGGAFADKTAAVVLALSSIVLVTIVSGAMVAKSGSVLSCGGWPLCNGALVPKFEDSGQVLHFVHRVLASVSVLGIVSGAFYLQALRHPAILSVIQVFMGLLVIWVYDAGTFGSHVLVGALHQLFALVIFASLIWGSWQPGGPR